MKVALPYGESTIEADVPDDATVLAPAHVAALDDPEAAVRARSRRRSGAARSARWCAPGQRAAIVVSDVTRPVPNQVILPPILETLEAGGVARDDITIVVGTGLHRASRPDEHQRFLGDAIMRDYRIVDHDARDRSTHAFFATGPVTAASGSIASTWTPTCASSPGSSSRTCSPATRAAAKRCCRRSRAADEIMANHDATMIGHPKATWCTTEGNPIFEQMRDVALKTDPSFTRERDAGRAEAHHGRLRRRVAWRRTMPRSRRPRARRSGRSRTSSMSSSSTNMGYPADLVLYQAVKGMSVGAQAVAPGGAILLVAECREGVGGESTSI